MLDKFFKKESPILGLLGMGGGIARGSSGLGPLEITGASVTSYSDSTHTWIVQTASNPITTNRGFDSADEVVNPDENKDARPWWDIFNFSCCGTERNGNIEVD